jgi:alkylated DNA repair dioxygenase AlkB
MPTLFSDSVLWNDTPEIPGLQLRKNYVTPAQEVELVAAIDGLPWDTTWDRRRQPYGAGYGQSRNASDPIPSWGLELIDRMHRDGISERAFDQMLINEYLPGQGIAMHCDYEPFDRTVTSLSLLSSCVMDFRHAETGQRAAVLLEPRSLLVLCDEARYEWLHGIARRKKDFWRGEVIPRARRLSVTCRLLKSG